MEITDHLFLPRISRKNQRYQEPSTFERKSSYGEKVKLSREQLPFKQNDSKLNAALPQPQRSKSIYANRKENERSHVKNTQGSIRSLQKSRKPSQGKSLISKLSGKIKSLTRKNRSPIPEGNMTKRVNSNIHTTSSPSRFSEALYSGNKKATEASAGESSPTQYSRAHQFKEDKGKAKSILITDRASSSPTRFSDAMTYLNSDNVPPARSERKSSSPSRYSQKANNNVRDQFYEEDPDKAQQNANTGNVEQYNDTAYPDQYGEQLNQQEQDNLNGTKENYGEDLRDQNQYADADQGQYGERITYRGQFEDV